jgi:hypothetical protein
LAVFFARVLPSKFIKDLEEIFLTEISLVHTKHQIINHNLCAGGSMNIRLWKIDWMFLLVLFAFAETAMSDDGRIADCPYGFTNMGLTCFRGPSLFWAPSKLAICPNGYTNVGYFCLNFPKSNTNMGCPQGYFLSPYTMRCHRNCPSGFENIGEFCLKPAVTLPASAMSCNSNEVKGGLADTRCYPQ